MRTNDGALCWGYAEGALASEASIRNEKSASVPRKLIRRAEPHVFTSATRLSARIPVNQDELDDDAVDTCRSFLFWARQPQRARLFDRSHPARYLQTLQKGRR